MIDKMNVINPVNFANLSILSNCARITMIEKMNVINPVNFAICPSCPTATGLP